MRNSAVANMRLQEDTSRMRDANVRLHGRILYLTEDPGFVRAQLAGNDPAWSPEQKLRDDISTDEITPAYICYYYDETLGEFPYLGLKCRDEFPISRGAVKRGGFVAAGSGKPRGKRTSPPHGPHTQMEARNTAVAPQSIQRLPPVHMQDPRSVPTYDCRIPVTN